MKDCTLVDQFEKEFGCVLDASPSTSSSSDGWNCLCHAIYNKAVKTFGFMQHITRYSGKMYAMNYKTGMIKGK